MSPAALLLLSAAFTALPAQFLTPEETVKLPAPAEVPAAPQTPAPAPQPAPAAPAPVPQATPAPAVEGDGFFSDFAAYGREKNIILTWHLVKGRTIERRIQIYRFSDEPRVIHDISRGTLIAKLSGEINLYEDVPPTRGAYYYAIFVESARGLEPASFTISRNLVGPIAFQSAAGPFMPAPNQPKVPETTVQHARPQFESEELDTEDEEEPQDDNRESAEQRHSRGINAVIRHTFLRGDYQETTRRLKPFFRNTSPRVRAKAMFYTGMARYRLGQYDRALKYFSHPLTRKYYRRNAEFWIKQTRENLR